MSDQEEMDQFDDLEGDDLEGAGSDDAPPPSDGDDAGATESKRVNDLMSKWQKAEASRKRAERELQELKKSGAQGGEKDREPDPEIEVWKEAQREFLRERAFNSDPRLAGYGLTSDAITGATPAEIKASVQRHVELIEAIESKARNRVLAEHGLTPEVSGGASHERIDVGSLSDKDFEDLIRRTKGQ